MRRKALVAILIAVTLAGIAEAQWTWTPQTGRWVNLRRMPKETPELQVEYARGLMLAGKYRNAMRETDKFIEFYGDDPLADENMYLRGEIQMAQGRWMEAAKTFNQLVSTYPDTDRYQEAVRKQYEIGDMYFERGEARSQKRFRLFKEAPYRRAAEVYAMVVENQPFAAEAAEAQYKIGLSHYAREQYIEAAYEYRRVVEDYSGSDWLDEAVFGLAMCYYRASLPPDYDQTPSELAVDAIDDFLNRYPDDERVAEMADRRAEMRESIATQRLEIARSYERRRAFPAAKLYYELLVRDFADTGAAETARLWLEENAAVRHVGDKYGGGIRSAL